MLREKELLTFRGLDATIYSRFLRGCSTSSLLYVSFHPAGFAFIYVILRIICFYHDTMNAER
jgi:hypothetical protein